MRARSQNVAYASESSTGAGHWCLVVNMWARGGRSVLRLHRHASRCSPLLIHPPQPLVTCTPQLPSGIFQSRLMSIVSWAREGDWHCTSCGNLNFAKRTSCNVCSRTKDETDKAKYVLILLIFYTSY